MPQRRPGRRSIPPEELHPNVPPKLKALYERLGSQSRLSKKLQVNVGYISNLFRKGTEPTDRTVKGQEVRSRLFLSRTKSRKAPPKEPKSEPEHIRWWKSLPREERDKVIKEYMEWKSRSS